MHGAWGEKGAGGGSKVIYVPADNTREFSACMAGSSLGPGGGCVVSTGRSMASGSPDAVTV